VTAVGQSAAGAGGQPGGAVHVGEGLRFAAAVALLALVAQFQNLNPGRDGGLAGTVVPGTDLIR